MFADQVTPVELLRHHRIDPFVFDRASGDYYIVDENSRNGTYINGEALTPSIPAAVWSGAYVGFGDAVFVFIDPATLRKLSKLAL